jgi:hypothetical protein
LYEEVVEVDERVVLQQEKCHLYTNCPVVTGTTGEKVIRGLDLFTIESFVELNSTTGGNLERS